MSFQSVKAQLAALELLVPGIKTSYAQAPNSVVAGNMPLVINLSGSATYEETAEEDDDTRQALQMIVRQYRLLVFVTPQQSGAPGEAEAQVEPFIDSIRRFFTGRPHLGLDGVQTAQLLGDSGVIGLTFQDQKYIGTEFQLEVTEYDVVPYADNE